MLCCLVFFSLCITLVLGAPTPWNYQPPDGYSLVWSDEFDGTSIDSTKWNHQTTCHPPNNEQQCYTKDPANSFVANGMLNIVAHQRTPIPSTANGMKYTSARIKTVQNFKYGTYVARIKGPYGKGIWPAFWMSGTATGDKIWPWTGEIDIMEYYGGSNPGADDTNAMSIHFAKGNVPTGTDVQASHAQYGQRMALQNGARYADAFHIYEAIWTPLSITGRIDGIDCLYVDTTNTDEFNEFNKEAIFFNIILNVAVGGNMNMSYIRGGGVVPDDDLNYSQTMLVDWVRVYQQSTQAINALISIPWVIPSLTPTPTGSVKFIDSEVPTSIAPRGTFGVKVSYIGLSHPTMLILELITPDGATKFGIGTKMVSPGTGTDTIIVPIRALINTAVQLRVYGVAAQNYFNGLGWRYALSPLDSRSVTVGTTMSYPAGVTPIRTPNPEGVISLQNALTTNTPPLSLISKQTFTVSITYTTDVISQIVIDVLNNVTYSKPTSGTITVQPGTATISIPMTWLSREVGNNFYYNMFLVKKSVYDANATAAWKSPYIGPITVNGVIISSIPTLTLLSPLPSALTVVTTTLQVKVDNSGSNLQLQYNQQGMPSSLFPIPSSSPAIVSFPITLNLTTNNHWWLDVINTQGQVMTTLDTHMTLIPTITTQTITPNRVAANDIATEDSTTTIVATSTCGTNANMGVLIGGIVGGLVIGAIVGTLITYYITKQQRIRVGNKDIIDSSSHITTPWTNNPVVEMTSHI